MKEKKVLESEREKSVRLGQKEGEEKRVSRRCKEK